MKKALIVVDVQNDFMPGGNLAVKDGDKIVPGINDLIASNPFDVLVFTQDCHPQNHGSFASNHPGKKPFEMDELNCLPQMLWPDHCVQGTKGMDFHPDLDVPMNSYTIFKGMDPNVDSYSAFYDNGGQNPSGLTDYLKSMGITDIDICGLAYDYCVYYTALDAVKEGFKVKVIKNLTKPVIDTPESIAKIEYQLVNAGVEIITWEKNV